MTRTSRNAAADGFIPYDKTAAPCEHGLWGLR